jgi:uncharacterized SAM-binding protein YcdF (DUF218 family)
MFIFKKIAGAFCYPLSFGLLILVGGLLLLWFTRRQRTGKLIVSIGVIFLLVCSYAWLPESLIKPLESRYPPLLQANSLPEVKWIVVLGGGHASDPRRPANSQLSSASLARVVEGIRLHRNLPGAKLILSGGAVFDPVPEARTMADTAAVLGINRADMVLEALAKDTEEQAVLIKKIIGNESFILVTSAAHMARSVALCKRQGMQPVAAPTDYQVDEERPGLHPARFFPSAQNLLMAESAVHEYLGAAWARLRGKI